GRPAVAGGALADREVAGAVRQRSFSALPACGPWGRGAGTDRHPGGAPAPERAGPVAARTPGGSRGQGGRAAPHPATASRPHTVKTKRTTDYKTKRTMDYTDNTDKKQRVKKGAV